jgi:hypothetical protein
MESLKRLYSKSWKKFGIVQIKYNSQTKIMMITDPERCNEITP